MEAEPSCDATVDNGKATFALVFMIELGVLFQKGAIFCCARQSSFCATGDGVPNKSSLSKPSCTMGM